MTNKANREDVLVAVVCTKDRPHRVREFVDHLINTNVPPRKIVFVDSTANHRWVEENNQSATLLREHGWEAHYLSDTPGLPHQRNTALKYISASIPQCEYVSFLDDDIFIPSSYFDDVQSIFETDDGIVVVGGYDANATQDRVRESRVLEKFGLLPGDHGRIAKSGLARVPRPRKEIEEVDFVPGGMQSLRRSLLKGALFNEESRFFGEDIEMHFKLSMNGKIVSSILLPVSHLGATESKQDNGSALLSEQLVRVRLHRQDPQRVTFLPLLAGCALAFVVELISVMRNGETSRIGSTLLEFGRAVNLTITNRKRPCPSSLE